jgi:hypothetical protein
MMAMMMPSVGPFQLVPHRVFSAVSVVENPTAKLA